MSLLGVTGRAGARATVAMGGGVVAAGGEVGEGAGGLRYRSRMF